MSSDQAGYGGDARAGPGRSGHGTSSGRTATDNVVDLLIAYRWIISIGVVLTAGGLFLAGLGASDLIGAVQEAIAAIPPEVWTAGHYALLGSPVGLLGGWFLYARFKERHHIEILEHWPHGDDHGHLWIGEGRMRDATVINLQGEEVTTAELKDCTVNGWPAVECVAYSPETNVFVASWLGGASTGELRSYRFAVEYIMDSLTQEADESIKERVAAKPVARMAGKDVVNHLVQMDEKATMPEEDRVSRTIERATDKFDISSPLDAYQSNGEEMTDQFGRPTHATEDGTETGADAPGDDSRTNGHGGEQ